MDLVLFHDLSNILLIAGIAILIIEAVILGFSTFVLLFLGLSLVLTGVGMKAGILDATYVTALWSNSLVTSVLAFTLWKPLRNMQSKVEVQDIESDFAQETFVLADDVDSSGGARHIYSGVPWKLKSQQPIKAGTTVKVVKTEVGVMWVEALDQPME
jgi:membrane protein implicated in regulation of membrane protease activity